MNKCSFTSRRTIVLFAAVGSHLLLQLATVGLLLQLAAVVILRLVLFVMVVGRCFLSERKKETSTTW